MTHHKAVDTEGNTDQSPASLLDRERKWLRTMKIVFAVFCVLLILSLVILLILNT
jgi:hypothetical protein